MATRTFLALDLDDLILDRLMDTQRRFAGEGGKINWVTRDNLHVTLAFLGDVTDEILRDVCLIAAQAAAEIEPFEFHVRGVECVPGGSGPLRMLWAIIEDPTGRLGKLYETLNESLAGMGLHEEERSFRPHVTLARVKFTKDPRSLREKARGLAAMEFGAQHAEEVVAYASRLSPQGPAYTAIARAKLGESA